MAPVGPAAQAGVRRAPAQGQQAGKCSLGPKLGHTRFPDPGKAVRFPLAFLVMSGRDGVEDKGGETPPPKNARGPIKSPIPGGGERLWGRDGVLGGRGWIDYVLGGLTGALAVKDLRVGVRSDLIGGPVR
jgi:hypothetical protein